MRSVSASLSALTSGGAAMAASATAVLGGVGTTSNWASYLRVISSLRLGFFLVGALVVFFLGAVLVAAAFFFPVALAAAVFLGAAFFGVAFTFFTSAMS